MKTRQSLCLMFLASGTALAQTPPPLVIVNEAEQPSEGRAQPLPADFDDESAYGYAEGDESDDYGSPEANPGPGPNQPGLWSDQNELWRSPQGEGEASAVHAATLQLQPSDVPVVASVADFNDALAPYGDWVLVNGVRVWRPSPRFVGSNFLPYTSSGQWVSTNAGWSFASTLPFGWATYHYGRWWNDPSFGWVWWPDTVWGPSWVDWRWGGGYAGWAPLAPRWAGSRYQPRWYFVPSGYFGSRYLTRYGVGYGNYRNVYSATRAVPHVRYGAREWSTGPSYDAVNRVARVAPVRRTLAFDGTVTRFGARPNARVAPPVYRSSPGVRQAAPNPYRGASPATRAPSPNGATPQYRSTPQSSRPSAPEQRNFQSTPSLGNRPQFRGAPSAPATIRSSAPSSRSGGGSAAPVYRGGESRRR